jgi:hypothetical protein
MTIARTVTALVAALSIATSALAGDLRSSAAQAASEVPPAQTLPMPSRSKPLVLGGAAVFASGIAAALYGFIRVANGQYSTFGEATSRNKHLGAAGIAAAFTGGTMMFMGSRGARYAPSVAVNRDGLAVAKQVSW